MFLLLRFYSLNSTLLDRNSKMVFPTILRDLANCGGMKHSVFYIQPCREWKSWCRRNPWNSIHRLAYEFHQFCKAFGEKIIIQISESHHFAKLLATTSREMWLKSSKFQALAICWCVFTGFVSYSFTIPQADFERRKQLEAERCLVCMISANEATQ